MRHPRTKAFATLLLVAPLSANSNSNDKWSQLDAELQALVQTPASAEGANEDGLSISGFVRANYANSQNLPAPSGMGDLGGFNMDAARLEFSGSLGNTQMVLSIDGFAGPIVLVDAYVVQPLAKHISLTAGQFRVPFLRTGLVDGDGLLFIARTVSSSFYWVRDVTTRGVMFEAVSGPVLFQLSGQNGADVLGDNKLLTGRVSWDVVGQGVGLIEGAYGSADDLTATIGVAFSDEQASPTDDGVAIAAEGALVWGPFSLQAEAVDYDTGYDPGVLSGRGGTTPASYTASWMPVRDVYELALRYDEFDDQFQRSMSSFGLNHYSAGGTVKLQVNLLHLESAAPGGDSNLVALGATMGF
jgi:hypothetical protein